jgi:2Fe-2S ferredoxin
VILRVIDRDGKEHALEAIEGWRVMEIIRDYAMQEPALGIKAECGAACACATCHVYVDEAWRGRLHPASAEETGKLLDEAFSVQPNSRLSCQILMRDELDGLTVTLAPGSEP